MQAYGETYSPTQGSERAESRPPMYGGGNVDHALKSSPLGFRTGGEENHGHPWFLTLDVHGQPHRWVSWQAACHYYALNMVAWTAGDRDFRFLGGISRATGVRSEITANSIIAIRGRALRASVLTAVPPLSNRELFHRDRQICAYCGDQLPGSHLTRDHVVPVSQGGRDIWMNVVTACRGCNQRKSGRTPEQARMALLYTPYVPNKAEYLILCNRHILADQMDFLARHLPRQSRLLPAVLFS